MDERLWFYRMMQTWPRFQPGLWAGENRLVFDYERYILFGGRRSSFVYSKRSGVFLRSKPTPQTPGGFTSHSKHTGGFPSLKASTSNAQRFYRMMQTWPRFQPGLEAGENRLVFGEEVPSFIQNAPGFSCPQSQPLKRPEVLLHTQNTPGFYCPQSQPSNARRFYFLRRFIHYIWICRGILQEKKSFKQLIRCNITNAIEWGRINLKVK